jgi:hypothetical protein
MADSIQKIRVEGGKEAEAAIQGVQTALENFNKTASKNRDAVRLLDKATGGAITKFQDFQKGISQGITSVKGLSKTFKGLRVAIAATGIGLIVVALGTIATYWEDITGFISGATAEQERLNRETQISKDLLNSEVDLLFKQLNLQELKGESIDETLVTLKKTLQIQKEKLLIELQEAELAAAKQKAQDEELGFFDKLEASFDVRKSSNYQENLARIQEEKRNETSEEYIGLLGIVDKIKGELITKDTQLENLDIKKQKRRKKELEDIKKTEQAEFDEFEKFLIEKEKLEDAYFQSKLDKETQEENKVRDKYFNLIAQAKLYKEDITSLEEAREAELKEINDKYKLERDEQKIKDQEALIEKLAIDKENEELSFEEQRAIIDQREKVLLADTTLTEEQRTQVAKGYADARVTITDLENKQKEDAIASYANSLGKISGAIGAETQAGKLTASAAALIATYLNANKARESQLAIATPDAPIRAALAMAAEIASGLANVKAINSVKVPNASGGGSTNAPVAPPVVSAPAFNIVGQSETSQLTETIAGANQEPIKAYVVSNDITTAQSLDRNIVQGATIG